MSTDVNLTLKRVDWFDATPNVVVLDKIARSANVSITGIQITSHALLEIKKCEYSDSPGICPFRYLLDFQSYIFLGRKIL